MKLCGAESTNLSYWREGFAGFGLWGQGYSPRLAQRIFFLGTE